MKIASSVKGTPLAPALTGLLILCLGLVWFFAVYIPQPAILSIMNTDPLTALYLILEHGILDACFILAAFYFTTAVLGRRASATDLGLTRFPLLDDEPAPGWQTLLSAILFMAACLALIIVGTLIILIVQGSWEGLVRLTTGL